MSGSPPAAGATPHLAIIAAARELQEIGPLRNLVADLTEGFEVELFLITESNDGPRLPGFDEGATRSIPLDAAPWCPFGIRLAWNLRRLHRRRLFDVVLSIGSGSQLRSTSFAARILRTPHVAGFFEGAPLPDARSGADLRALRRAVAVVAGSGRLESELRKMLGEGSAPAPQRIPFGAETVRFPPKARPPRQVPLLLSAAPLDLAHDPLALLEAFRIVRRKRPVRMLVAGDGPLAGELARRAREAGVDTEFVLLGLVTEAEFPALAAEADLFVASPARGTAGVELFEAAAAGLPIVTTATGPAADLVAAGAAVAAEATPVAMASLIGELLDDPTRRAALASAARSFAIASDRPRASGALTEILGAAASLRNRAAKNP